MKTHLWLWLVVGVSLCTASAAVAQTPVGALAIDGSQGDQWGWAVDYETAVAARDVALRECGSGCSVVLTFERCGAYAADQDAASTAVGWGQSYASSSDAREAALRECRSRGGGSGCVVRVWGCNGPVVEEALGLDRAAPSDRSSEPIQGGTGQLNSQPTPPLRGGATHLPGVDSAAGSEQN